MVKYLFCRFIGWNIIYFVAVMIIGSCLMSFIDMLFFKKIVYTYNSELLEQVDNMILFSKHIILSGLIFIIGIFIATHMAFKQVFLKPHTTIKVIPSFRRVPFVLTLNFYGLLQITNSIFVIISLLALDHNWILKAVHYYKYNQKEFLYLLANQLATKYSIIFTFINIFLVYFIFKSILLRNAEIKRI